MPPETPIFGGDGDWKCGDHLLQATKISRASYAEAVKRAYRENPAMFDAVHTPRTTPDQREAARKFRANLAQNLGIAPPAPKKTLVFEVEPFVSAFSKVVLGSFAVAFGVVLVGGAVKFVLWLFS